MFVLTFCLRGFVLQGFSFRDSGTNAKGISYSFVTSKTLKPLEAPTNVVLQQSDFPSLSPMKAELTAKSAQDTVWGKSFAISIRVIHFSMVSIMTSAVWPSSIIAKLFCRFKSRWFFHTEIVTRKLVFKLGSLASIF